MGRGVLVGVRVGVRVEDDDVLPCEMVPCETLTVPPPVLEMEVEEVERGVRGVLGVLGVATYLTTFPNVERIDRAPSAATLFAFSPKRHSSRLRMRWRNSWSEGN